MIVTFFYQSTPIELGKQYPSETSIRDSILYSDKECKINIGIIKYNNLLIKNNPPVASIEANIVLINSIDQIKLSYFRQFNINEVVNASIIYKNGSFSTVTNVTRSYVNSTIRQLTFTY